MKRTVYLIIEAALVLACAALMIVNLTPRGSQQAATTDAAASLTGSYSFNTTYIWMADYQKNLLGDQTQQLDLFSDNTYVLSNSISCIANMDTDIVTGAQYDPFYFSRLTVTGQYEVVSESDELGIMTIRLTSANLKAVNGNAEMWPMENEGELNFSVTASDATISVDTAALSFSEAVPMYAMNEAPAA